MKKPFIIFSAFLLIVSGLVYSCGTKDDPPVPDHLTNITTVSNSVNFHTFLFSLGFKNCDIDSTAGNHWTMRGKDVNQNFAIAILFADMSAPASFPLTYSVVDPSVSVLNTGQCTIVLSSPTVSASPWVGTGGMISLSLSHGNIMVVMKNIPVMNISDSTQTSTITGDWTCP